MTNVARRINRLQRVLFLYCGIGLVLSMLGGCGGISLSLPSSSSDNKTQKNNTVERVSAKPAARVAFAPVFGPPIKVAQKISSTLQSESQARQITVVQSNEGPQYTIRGYLSASPDKAGTKLSYIWDVTNQAGKRVHRIKGEEIVPGPQNTRDPWALIDQNAVKAIASNTANRLANWLPRDNSRNLVRQASLNNSERGGATNIRSGRVIAVVPDVQGAPGDGSRSLATALRNQLGNRGIKVSSVGSVSKPYRVIGIVNLASAGNNQQKIKIEWIVRDPNNKKLGVVTQKNVIPAGSLDGAWGQTANAAASAAAQGIAKLLKN